MAKLLDGKELASKIIEQVKQEVSSLPKQPVLAVVHVGTCSASEMYIRQKKKACERAGIEFNDVALPENTDTGELLKTIEKLNQNPEITAFMLQLPLPSYLNYKDFVCKVIPAKDVDGLNPLSSISPATPKGIMKLLQENTISLAGKHAVVVGRSLLVGKPLADLLLAADCTVSICHSKTANLCSLTQQADILISAVGKPNLITVDMVKKGSVVVDVGISRVDGKLVGDVDFDSVKNKVSFITPVPGGVGPMTVACLLENVLECAKLA